MDIGKREDSRAAQEIPARVELMDPDTGEPFKAPDGVEDFVAPAVYVLGNDAKVVRDAKNRGYARLAAERRAARDARGDDDDEELDEEIEGLVMRLDLRVERVTAGCVSWEGIDDDGEPLEFNAKNLERLLAFEDVVGQLEIGMRLHEVFSIAQSEG